MDNVLGKLKENKLIISIIGKVDTNNADEIEKSVMSIINEHNFSEMDDNKELIIDANDLLYISSAGLRIVLRIRKSNPTMRIINASSEVYDIFNMTGFSEMIPIEKALRKLSVEGCEIIGTGAKGIIYRYDAETIIKVYNNPESLPEIQNERNLARKAFILGVPTAISYDVVKVDDKYGAVFELLDASSCSEIIKEHPEQFDKCVKDMADLLRLIHTTKVQPADMPDIKPLIYNWLETDKEYLSEEEYIKIKKLIDETPDKHTMLHCDFHTNNVMQQGGETLMIDMDTISRGHPIFDIANIYITFVGFGEINPKMVENFLGLNYETALRFWNAFVPVYLGTENEEKIEELTKKAKLLSSIRYMRHVIRRNQADTEEGKKIIEKCKENINEVLPDIEGLIF